MTVTLDLKPEVEAGLLAHAQACRMTVEGFLMAMVESALSADQRAAAFEAWSANHRATPPLSAYAVSRDSMYEDRDR